MDKLVAVTGLSYPTIDIPYATSLALDLSSGMAHNNSSLQRVAHFEGSLELEMTRVKAKWGVGRDLHAHLKSRAEGEDVHWADGVFDFRRLYLLSEGVCMTDYRAPYDVKAVGAALCSSSSGIHIPLAAYSVRQVGAPEVEPVVGRVELQRMAVGDIHHIC